MSKRTIIVLAVVNAALLAFILLFERGTLSTSDVSRRSRHVLTHFVRDEVTRVELVRGDEPPIVFEREREDDEEVGTWRITEPLAATADSDAVDSFLGALEWLEARRTLEDISAADRTRFGLVDPRFVVRFRVAEQQMELLVGGEAPTGDGVYAAVAGSDGAYVIGDDFIEAVDHDLAHFRDKELFATFYPSDATAIELTGGGAPLSIEREDGVWRLREPLTGWASGGLVDDLLGVTRGLRATRFVDEAPDPSELSEYGLTSPWRALRVTRPEGAAGDQEITLRVGAPCGEHDGERYARVDEGPVVCVTAGDVQPLEVDRERLRELRLLTVGDDAVERIELAASGQRLELRRVEDGWQITTGPADAPGEARPAEDQAIATWLGELRELRARAFEPAPSHGASAPRAELTLHRSDSDRTVTLRLGEGDAEGAWVHRGDEAVVGQYPARVVELLSVDPLRFRDRALVSADATDATSVAVRRGGVDERAVRGEGGTWALEAPIEVEADRVVVRELARQVAGLRASRFVAARPSAEHGLTSPRAVVSVTFEPEGGASRTVVVRVGAATDEGAFAQLGDDPAVFLLPLEGAEAMLRPLVSLDLLTIAPDELTALRVERGETTIALTRDGTTWTAADGSRPHAERTAGLLDRLATLRASGVVRYGAPDAALGLDPPAVRLVGTRGDDGSVTLVFGAPRGEGDAAFVPVSRSDVDVVYRLRPELARVFFDYAP